MRTAPPSTTSRVTAALDQGHSGEWITGRPEHEDLPRGSMPLDAPTVLGHSHDTIIGEHDKCVPPVLEPERFDDAQRKLEVAVEAGIQHSLDGVLGPGCAPHGDADHGPLTAQNSAGDHSASRLD
jgi:hypothetical protein